MSAPARAERHIHHDRTHDVVGVRVDADDRPSVRPGQRQGDYVKVKTWHRTKTVRVVGKFRRLDRTGRFLAQVVAVRTPDGREHTFAVAAGPGSWKGLEVSLDDAQDDCFVGHKVHYRRDRFSINVSRACLGRPAWVRVGVGFTTWRARTVSADDALSRTVRGNLTFSPRLVHGTPR